MKALNTNILLKPNGDTKDIASAVISVYNSDYSQVSEIAQTLEAETTAETCYNIFNYLLDHVQYNEDPAGVQWVKTPARLLSDGSGDCKSFSIFIASCLRCLGINHCFRFVSYNNRKDATHVYVIAKPETRNPEHEIILDAVVRVNGLPRFNYQEKYTYKSDMDGTKIYKMAGLPDPGSGGDMGNPIGDVTGVDEERYAVWTGDETENNITPGKHYLYSRFDYLLEKVNTASTEVEQLFSFDQLDITTALLAAYNHVNGETESYRHIAFIVCHHVAKGSFRSLSLVEDVRGDGLDEMINRVKNDYDYKFDVNNDPTIYDRATWAMLQENVFPFNELVAISGIGSFWPWDKVADLLKSSGYWFLYSYIPDNELKNYPAAVAKKRAAQLQVKKWLWIDLFHKEATRENLIRAGIIARVGMEPEAYIAKCKRDNVRIGEPITLATISAIIGIALGLVALVRAIWPPKTSPTNDDIKNGAADVNAELFTMKKKDPTGTGSGTTSAGFTSYALPIALGLSLIISKFSKKK